VGYAGFYLLLEWKAGLISIPLLLGASFKTNDWLNEPGSQFNKTLIALFVIGWVVQFIGHGFFEKRAPALLDNLLQAVVLAPFFVLFEGLFLLGYRTDLKTTIDKRVEVNIAEFKKSKLKN
jgi:uncharacterized membrane protein YGL010W